MSITHVTWGSHDKSKTSTVLLSLLLLFTLALAACGGGTTQPTTTAQKSVLRVAAQSSDFTQAGFNPYNTHADAGIGLLYETLYFVNVNGGGFTPWRATSFPWARVKNKSTVQHHHGLTF